MSSRDAAAPPALGSSSSPSPSPHPLPRPGPAAFSDDADVETTNWNAVRALASKYGVTLGPQTDVDPPSNSHGAVTPIDLGVGTPFKIEARPTDGGRVLYRFHVRKTSTHDELQKAIGRSSNENASSQQRYPAGLAPPVPKKQAFKTLRPSRSIPALRSRAASGTLWGLGPSPAPQGPTLRSVSAKTPTPQQQHKLPSIETGPGFASTSRPVPGPFAVRAEGSAHDYGGQGIVQGGDVLGAILDIPKDLSRTAPDRSASSNEPLAGLFSSSMQRTSGSRLRTFGNAVAVDRRPTPSTKAPDRTSQGASSSALLDETNWDHSPIPQISDVGAPLFEDLNAFAEELGDSQSVPQKGRGPPSTAAEGATSDQDRHLLREMQSFETTASTGTARPDEGHPSVPPQSKGSSFGDPSKTYIFDVFQSCESISSRPGGTLITPSRQSSRSEDHVESLAHRSAGNGLSVLPADESISQTSISSAQDTSTDAAPADDPRFVLWAMPDSIDSQTLLLSDRDGLASEESDVGRSRQPSSPSTQSSASSSAEGRRKTPSLTKRRMSRVADHPTFSPYLSQTPRQRMPSANSANSRLSASLSSTSNVKASPQGQQPLTTRSKASAIAATPARLVAEITAEIHSRLMTDFFYTFRNFMTTHELLDLLIARFHWALSEPWSPQDDARRRIVRVRTYVVIKYWITNFFEVDFLGDKVVRTSLTDWLNALGKDPRLPSRPAEMSIVTSLKKVVRNLKHVYAKTGVSSLVREEARQAGTSTERLSQEKSTQNAHTLSRGDFTTLPADVRRRGEEAQAELSKEEQARASTSPRRQTALRPPLEGPSSPNLQNNAVSRALANTVGRLSRLKRTIEHHLVLPGAEGGGGGGGGSDGFDFDSTETGDLLYMRGGVANLIQQFHLDRDDHTQQPDHDGSHNGMSDDPGATDETPSLSTSSAISRSTPSSSLELSEDQREERPLPTISLPPGQQALGLGIDVPDYDDKVSGPSIDQAALFRPEDFSRGRRASVSHAAAEEHSRDENPTAELSQQLPSLQMDDLAEPRSSTESMASQDDIRTSAHDGRIAKTATVHHADSDQTLRSIGSSSAGASRSAGQAPLRTLRVAGRLDPAPHIGGERMSAESSRSRFGRHSFSSTTSRPNFKVVQLDEADLSSDEDDGGVRRALRRLPGVRNLRTANNVQDVRLQRQSLDSLASFGAVYSTRGRPSMASVRMSHRPSASFDAASERVDLFDPDDALAGYELVKGFRVEDFGSDDEEPGDVEEALRRLEGFIDDDKKAERARRVETLWEQSRARQEGPRAEDGQAQSRASSESQGADQEDSSRSGGGTSCAGSSVSSSQQGPPHASLPQDDPARQTSLVAETATPVPQRDVSDLKDAGSQPASDSGGVASTSPKAPMSAGRRALLTAQEQGARSRPQLPSNLLPPPNFVPPHILNGPAPIHRCFLLNYKSEVIAQQFTLIEAELFKAVDWTELVSDRWRQRRHKSEVLDWESFYQDRVRAKATAAAEGTAYRDTAVEAIIARFNLTCNWVASEVVLTRNLEERVAVISKLIRIAFRCYQYLNFATVVQICLGLQTPWVERLTKTWARVSSRDMRILRDLKALTSPARNFRHLRAAMRGMVEEGSLEDLVTVSGPPRTGAAGAGVSGGKGIGVRMDDCCVPFFGLFITDLAVNECLPSFVDPSAPNSAAEVDPTTRRLLRLQNPDAFAHLPPLPRDVSLEPLVNLFKFRNIAGTVKTVLAFQAKTANYDFHADAGVYVKCLKIRCLEGRHMTDLSNRLEH